MTALHTLNDSVCHLLQTSMVLSQMFSAAVFEMRNLHLGLGLRIGLALGSGLGLRVKVNKTVATPDCGSLMH